MTNPFDQRAKDMDQNPRTQEVAEAFAGNVKEHVPLQKTFRVLDFGCGSGAIGMRLQEHVGELIMMDNSEGMLALVEEKIAERNASNIRIVKGSLDELMAEARGFDLAYMNNVLHHIRDIESLFAAMRKALKTGGHFCIGDLRSEDGSFHRHNPNVPHCGFDEPTLEKTLRDIGFGDIAWKEYHIIQKPDADGTLRNYPMFFMTAQKAK